MKNDILSTKKNQLISNPPIMMCRTRFLFDQKKLKFFQNGLQYG